MTQIKRHVQSLLALRLFPPIQTNSSHSSGRRTVADSAYERHSSQKESSQCREKRTSEPNQRESARGAQDLREQEAHHKGHKLITQADKKQSIIGHL
jgi:hypothetical protein